MIALIAARCAFPLKILKIKPKIKEMVYFNRLCAHVEYGKDLRKPIEKLNIESLRKRGEVKLKHPKAKSKKHLYFR
jgi:hypothetical protein